MEREPALHLYSVVNDFQTVLKRAGLKDSTVRHYALEFEKEVWMRAEQTATRKMVSLASLRDIAALKTKWQQHMPTIVEHRRQKMLEAMQKKKDPTDAGSEKAEVEAAGGSYGGPPHALPAFEQQHAANASGPSWLTPAKRPAAPVPFPPFAPSAASSPPPGMPVYMAPPAPDLLPSTLPPVSPYLSSGPPPLPPSQRFVYGDHTRLLRGPDDLGLIGMPKKRRAGRAASGHVLDQDSAAGAQVILAQNTEHEEGVTYGYLFAVTSTPTPLELAKNPELVSEATLSVEDLGWAKWKTEMRPDQLGLVCMYTQNHFPANGACAKPTAEGLGLTPAKLLPDVQEYFREIAFRLYEHNFPVKVFRSLEEPQEDTGTVLLEALGMALGALEAKRKTPTEYGGNPIVVRKSAGGEFKLHPTAAQRTQDSPFGLVAPKDEDSDEGYLFLLDTLILPTTYDATPLMIRAHFQCFALLDSIKVAFSFNKAATKWLERRYGKLHMDLTRSTMSLRVSVASRDEKADGSSAGHAFVVDIAARCVGCQVPLNLGLTGEASLTGKIYPVMGLRPKLIGGAKSGTVAEPFNVLVGAGNLKGQGKQPLVERDESLPHAPNVHVKVPKASRDKLHIVGAETLFDSIELCLLKDGNANVPQPVQLEGVIEATAIVTASDGSVAAPVELFLSKGTGGLQVTMAGAMRVLQVHDILDLTKSAYKKTILPAMGLPTNWRNRVHGTILDGYALHVNYPGYSSKDTSDVGLATTVGFWCVWLEKCLPSDVAFMGATRSKGELCPFNGNLKPIVDAARVAGMRTLYVEHGAAERWNQEHGGHGHGAVQVLGVKNSLDLVGAFIRDLEDVPEEDPEAE